MTVEGSMALRNHLSDGVDQVERTHDRVVITKHGKAAAVVVSVDDLASLEETLQVGGRPKFMQQVCVSLLELDRAEVLSRAQILTEKAATAAVEFGFGSLATNPHRVDKALRFELLGLHSAPEATFASSVESMTTS